MSNSVKRSRLLGAVVLAVLAAPVGASVAGTQDVTSMSGSQSCPAGQTVRIMVGLNHTQTVRGYWPSHRSTPNGTRVADVVVTMETGLRSTTWRVTGDSLSTGSDDCH